jgi:choline dehydrogenase-like flavoprotein
MILDCENIAQTDVRHSSVTVVGAGPAGIVLALELEKKGLSVNLLEGGGLNFESSSQALYRGELTGRKYYDLDASRVRMFGGTSTHWAGNCRQLSEIDFKKRDWMVNSGWPIGYEDIQQYYNRAANYLKLDPIKGNIPENWVDNNLIAPKHSDLTDIHTTQFSPLASDSNPFTALNFGKEYKSRIASSKLISLFLHANVTSIESNGSGMKIEHLNVQTMNEKKLQFTSKQFIIAAGGIDNARLLLVSDSANKSGVGNWHDNVGRYFMEHMEVGIGVMVPTQSRSTKYDMFDLPLNRLNNDSSNQLRTKAYYTFSDSTQQENKLLSTKIGLSRINVSRANGSKAFLSFKALFNDLKHGIYTEGFGYHLRNVVLGIDDITEGIYSKLSPSYNQPNLFYVQLQSEHEPLRSNRVSLIDEIDSLGMKRVKLNWQLSENDYRSIRAAAEVIGREFGAAGQGRMRIELPESNQELDSKIQGAWHHMGTTRMSASAEDGVVDKNCKVFNISNLFVAGSSVFPTGGHSVPTFTIVALAIRLADHLGTLKDD